MAEAERNSDSVDQKRVALILFSFTAAAIALRFAFQLRFDPGDFPDARAYLKNGLDFWHSGRIVSDIMMPLYPVITGLLGPKYILILQALASGLLVPIAYFLSFAVFQSVPSALIAAALMVVDPLTTYYAGQRLTESLYTVLLAFAILLLYRNRYLLGSVVFVCSLLIRPTLDIAGPLLIACVCLTNDNFVFSKRILYKVGMYLAIYVALMSPWWWHNYQKYNRFVRLNLGDGVVLRVEHNPQFAQSGFDWERLTPLLTEFDGVKDAVLRNNLYRAAALDYIRERPLHYLSLVVRRFGRFWSPVFNQSEPMRTTWKTRIPVFVFNLLILLSVTGTLLIQRKEDLLRSVPIYLVICFLSTVHILIHAITRYRVPLTPLLIVIASGVLAHPKTLQRLLRRNPQERSDPNLNHPEGDPLVHARCRAV